MKTSKRSIRLSSLGLCLLLTSTLFAQGNFDSCDLAERQTRCYFHNSETLWNELIQEIKNDSSLENDPALQYELVKCYYGLAGVYMSTYDGEKGVPVLEQAVAATKKLLKQDSKNANYHAMMSALYGMQIGFSPMKGMFLGSKSERHVEKAIEIDPNNGFAWSQNASSFYHTPSMFGGDIGEAVKAYEKAVALFEADGELSTNWHWLEAMTWLGQAYEKNGQPQLAMRTYERALNEFPEFGWINMALLPSLKKKLN